MQLSLTLNDLYFNILRWLYFSVEQIKQMNTCLRYSTYSQLISIDKVEDWSPKFQILKFMKTKYQSGDEVQMVIKTQKESQTGLFSNERLLMIKAGIVSYFSSIPKKFTGSARAIEMSGQVPKFTIAANEISKIQLKGNELSILVLKSKLISRDEMGQMIKGTKDIPQIHGNAKGDGGGYQQWIFKSEDEDSLVQFYHLINLFRTNDPNFQPHLAQMVEGFQKKKNPRKKTMDPSAMFQRPPQTFAAHRRSEVVQSKNEQFLIEKQKQVIIKPPLPPSFSQEDVLKQEIPIVQKQSEEIKVEEDIESFEQQRLNLVKDKINMHNHPRMSIIEQKPGQDKMSEMSRATFLNQVPIIEVIKTFEQSLPSISSNGINEQTIQEEPKPQQQPPHQQIQQIKFQPVLVLEQQKIEQKKVIQEQQIPKVQPQRKACQILSQSNVEQIMVEFEVKQQRKLKVNQLIKSACLLHKNDHKSMAKSLGISVEQLVEFLNVNRQDQQETWQFIENQLVKIVAVQKSKSKESTIFELSTQLISEYHSLSDCSSNSELKSYELLEGEISFESHQQEDQNQNMIMQWLRFQVSNQLSKSFSTKIFNKFQNKIFLRKIFFDQKQIIATSGSWIVNKGGHLQQFLAYLCLQKILKELNQKQKGKFQFECAEQFYIKYKQYEALIKPLNINNSLYPLKSIKALEFFSKSKGIKYFQRCFPQFSINVQILKAEDLYKFSLERISDSFELSAIQNQLQKLNFNIDSQLQQYYNTVSYQKTRKQCLNLLAQIQAHNIKINENTFQQIIAKSSSHIQIDIIFKFLGARSNKNNQISFQPLILRLGSRQFGSQISLIKKTKKRGNLQLCHALSMKLMSKLQFYRHVTPSNHFVAVYLQLIDTMILQKSELHKAVPALLRLSHFLNQFQIQNYSVYLALMRTYIKLHQIQNFIKTLQNCRLFLSKLLKENSFIFDFQLCRIIVALNTFQNLQKGLDMSQSVIEKMNSCQDLPGELRQKYLSKLIWDKSNIYITKLEYYQSFSIIYSHLQSLQKTQNCLQSYWIQGVLYLAKSWLQMQEVSIMNAASLQKKVQRAISLSLSRQLFDIAFLLKDYGQKIIQKCREYSLPRWLQNQPSYEQTKIWFNNIREQMLELIVEVE